MQTQLYTFFKLNATARALYPREGAQVPVVHEDGWATESVWTGVEKIKFYVL